MKPSAQKNLLSCQTQELAEPNVFKRVGKLILPARFFPDKSDSDKPPDPAEDITGFRTEVEERFIQAEDLEKASEEEKIRLVKDLRRAMSEGLTFDDAWGGNAFIRSLKERAECADNCERNSDIADRRAKVASDIYVKYRDIMCSWEENEKALTDGVMEECFERKDWNVAVDDFGNSFLTTYFGGAQFGLKNKLLDAEAEKRAHQKRKFNDCLAGDLRQFIDLFALSHSDRFNSVNSKGIPINVIFERNGTEAFKLFFRKFLGEKDKMLITAEEYIKMFKGLVTAEEYAKILRGEGDRIITLPEYSEFSSYEGYERAIEGVLSSDENIRYMLASSLSRSGTLFPLDRFHELCKKYEAELVADTCQSTGRMPTDISADVIFGSIHKGSELGGTPIGFLMLADDFIQKNNPEQIAQLANLDDGGHFDPVVLARAIYAVNSVELGTLVDEQSNEIEPITPSERKRITKDLAKKFAQLVQGINKKNDNRIEFRNDHLIYSGDKINEDQLSPIFECRIKGVTLGQVHDIAQKYGVVINKYSHPWEEESSFRITFLSFMGNESIEIIGHVLDECCETYK